MIQEVIPQSVPPNDRPEYIALAKDFRLPFWDWAKKPTDLPAIAKDPTISVFFPQAKYSIPNPLYKFTTTEVMGNLGIFDLDGVPVRFFPFDAKFYSCHRNFTVFESQDYKQVSAAAEEPPSKRVDQRHPR